jgi:UPF0716 family protein affecting phage T7 exclusion
VVRRLTLALSLATVAVGVWLIVREHGPNNACQILSSPLTGTGVGLNCQSVLALYFLGFVLVIGGLLITALALVAMVRSDRAARREQAVVAQRRIEARRGLRDAA